MRETVSSNRHPLIGVALAHLALALAGMARVTGRPWPRPGAGLILRHELGLKKALIVGAVSKCGIRTRA